VKHGESQLTINGSRILNDKFDISARIMKGVIESEKLSVICDIDEISLRVAESDNDLIVRNMK
jgi:hypothetical protein